MALQKQLFKTLVTYKSFSPCKRTVLHLNSASRHLSTSTLLLKNTPATIGVMSWVRSAARRKFLEQKMKEAVKSEDELLKEELLNRSIPIIEFRTSNRIHDKLNEDNMLGHLVKPTVFLSKDKETIVCYHPPPKPYPESFTKRAVGKSLFETNKNIFETFQTSMTDEQVAEAVKLRESDPRLWNTAALSKLFKVKPDILKAFAPMSKSQNERAVAEKEVYQSMSVMKRKQFSDLQKWERLKYIRETRGRQFALWYESLDGSVKPKAYVPPRL